MRLLFILIAHLLVTLARLARPGGVRAVAAESLAVKHQLLIMKRSQRRSPNLTAWDRVILGFCTLLVSPRRWGKISVILKTSTLRRLHRALVKRKYRLPYSSRRCGRPGPKGPSRELIEAMVEMKRRNPYFGCRKIAEEFSNASVGEDRFVCKVSHANRRPILFLPDRAQHPGLPTGWTDVSIERETYEANFVKIALNVVRRKGSDANELPGILRRWFGPNAGLPGTDFRVALDRSASGYVLVPLGRGDQTLQLEVGRSYSREQIPACLGCPSNPLSGRRGLCFSSNACSFW